MWIMIYVWIQVYFYASKMFVSVPIMMKCNWSVAILLLVSCHTYTHTCTLDKVRVSGPNGCEIEVGCFLAQFGGVISPPKCLPSDQHSHNLCCFGCKLRYIFRLLWILLCRVRTDNCLLYPLYSVRSYTIHINTINIYILYTY